MNRFVQYSLAHNRPIRLMYMTGDGALHQVTAVVTGREGDVLSLHVLRPPENLTLTMDALLSADYMKGDEGQS